MNFVSLEQNPNQQMTLFAQVQNIGETKYSKNGHPYQTCTLVDDTGTQRLVKIYQGSGSPLSQSHINQRLRFNLKAYRAPNGNVYLSGFWQNDQAPQAAPQPAPQAVPQPAAQKPPCMQQQQNRLSLPDRYGYPKTPQEQGQICRQAAGKVAAQLLAGAYNSTERPAEEILTAILKIARPLAKWYYDGTLPQEPIPEPEEEPEDDLPF